eukprot:CAMPEP_0171692494 /NCGR_PEP_ID=MMETSP0991-20121206/6108_1 /TAXON_ID=483369 /ORGANISM="non described non described, Strain CCMP2098" /LENGTH=44 /DNA_ID= /DNA_START= /DNA_END= /DNA_ORIENTATION=
MTSSDFGQAGKPHNPNSYEFPKLACAYMQPFSAAARQRSKDFDA